MADAAPLKLRGMRVCLGSTSKWRRQLLASHFPGLDFDTAAADIDEKAVTAGFADRGSADAGVLTLALAHAKADAIAPSLPAGTLLITSDQVLSFRGTIREVSAAVRREPMRGALLFNWC
jgi:predicted house-cleaning NTP pyrophosphatase (Maf/HAM1 superfamily)